MSVFVHATAASQPKTVYSAKVAILAAVLLAGMALAQLFNFTKFGGVVYDMWLPGDTGQFSNVFAALIVTAEVFALPFLLGMRLSPLMRVFSMGLGWLVVVGWLFVLVWQNVTVNALANCGLLGAIVHLPVGWWSVCFMLGMGVLVAWASWGRWPFPIHRGA